MDINNEIIDIHNLTFDNKFQPNDSLIIGQFIKPNQDGKLVAVQIKLRSPLSIYEIIIQDNQNNILDSRQFEYKVEDAPIKIYLHKKPKLEKNKIYKILVKCLHEKVGGMIIYVTTKNNYENGCMFFYDKQNKILKSNNIDLYFATFMES